MSLIAYPLIDLLRVFIIRIKEKNPHLIQIKIIFIISY